MRANDRKRLHGNGSIPYNSVTNVCEITNLWYIVVVQIYNLPYVVLGRTTDRTGVPDMSFFRKLLLMICLLALAAVFVTAAPALAEQDADMESQVTVTTESDSFLSRLKQ